MTWFIKNWYFVLIAIAVVIWILLDPSYERKDELKIDMAQQTEEMDEEIETTEETVTEYMVDIKGAVKQPGVYQVKEQNRVKDVIKMAGGLEKTADQEAINLAERVFDEMVIFVPFIGEEAASPADHLDDGKIRINQVTAEEITSIPGIGQVKANAIVEYRDTHGKFVEMEDLLKVSGIGEKTVELMKEHVRIP